MTSPSNSSQKSGVFRIGNVEYTIEAPWFFTDDHVFQANRFRKLTDAELILDAMPFVREEFENDMAIAIGEYCSGMHSEAMLNWLCERYHDTYQVKRHRLSLAGDVGWCYLWLRFLDRVFKLEPRCTPIETAQISWRHVDVWDLIFREYMFTDPVLIHDTYNPVCWERILQRQKWAPQIRKEDKEIAAQKERENERAVLGGATHPSPGGGSAGRQATNGGATPTEQWGAAADDRDDDETRQRLYEQGGFSQRTPTISEHLAEEARRVQESMADLRKSTLHFQAPVAQSAASRFFAPGAADVRRIMHAVDEEDRQGTRVASSQGGTNAATASASSSSAAAGATFANDDPLPVLAVGQTYRSYCETYIVPKKDMTFSHQDQFQGSPREIRDLRRIFDMLILKIQFGSVHPLEELKTAEDWRTILNALECVSCILFIQFQHQDNEAIETYVRILVWIESQLQIFDTFALADIEFKPETYEALQAHLDEFMEGETEPDNQLLDAVNRSVYLHRMPTGIPIAFFQKNPFQTTKRNPISILNEELPEHALRYMNDFLLSAKPRDIYANKQHPFHRMFVYVLFACNLKWNKNHFDWLNTYTVFNFNLMMKLSDLHRNCNDEEEPSCPMNFTLLGHDVTLSHWHKTNPSDAHAVATPTLYRAQTSEKKILNWFFLLLYHYDGHLEDGYALGRYLHHVFRFEEVYSQLSVFESILGVDPEDLASENDLSGADDDDDDEEKEHRTVDPANIEARRRLVDASASQLHPRTAPRPRVLGLDEPDDDEDNDDYNNNRDAAAKAASSATHGAVMHPTESVMHAFRQLAMNPNAVFGADLSGDINVRPNSSSAAAAAATNNNEDDDYEIIPIESPLRSDAEQDDDDAEEQKEPDDHSLEENGLYS